MKINTYFKPENKDERKGPHKSVGIETDRTNRSHITDQCTNIFMWFKNSKTKTLNDPIQITS